MAACNNKRPIQAAVLHGLSVIATIVQPNMLTNDTSLTELLAQGAEWAANLGYFYMLQIHKICFCIFAMSSSPVIPLDLF